jgi:hypothetical protein
MTCEPTLAHDGCGFTKTSIILQRLEESNRSGASEEAWPIVSTMSLASHIICLTKPIMTAHAIPRVIRLIFAIVSYLSYSVMSRRVN